jgi:predicted lactoylglutathione lyase
MARQIFINLPVKDLGKSKDFFGALGFGFRESKGQSRSISLRTSLTPVQGRIE